MIIITTPTAELSLDRAGFLALVQRLADNTCVVARSIYLACKRGQPDLAREAEAYALTQTECQALQAVIVDRDFRIGVAILNKIDIVRWWAAQIAAVRTMHPQALAKLAPGVAESGPQRAARRKVRDGLQMMREAVIELQVNLIGIGAAIPMLQLRPDAASVLREAGAVTLLAPLDLPPLAGKRPFKMPPVLTVAEALALQGDRRRSVWNKLAPSPRSLEDRIDACLVEREPDHRRAIRKLRRLLVEAQADDIQLGKVYYLLAAHWEELRNDRKAVEYYGQAIELAGENEFELQSLLAERGLAYYRLKQLTEAKEDFKGALAANAAIAASMPEAIRGDLPFFAEGLLDEARACLAAIRATESSA